MSTNQHEVVKLFKANPLATSTEIADQLDCDSAYVRATLRRKGLKLAHSAIKGDCRRGVLALGQAAKEAGLTVGDIKRLAKSGNAQ